eukprot:2875026-Amphidinium_carterae.1
MMFMWFGEYPETIRNSVRLIERDGRDFRSRVRDVRLFVSGKRELEPPSSKKSSSNHRPGQKRCNQLCAQCQSHTYDENAPSK